MARGALTEASGAGPSWLRPLRASQGAGHRGPVAVEVPLHDLCHAGLPGRVLPLRFPRHPCAPQRCCGHPEVNLPPPPPAPPRPAPPRPTGAHTYRYICKSIEAQLACTARVRGSSEGVAESAVIRVAVLAGFRFRCPFLRRPVPRSTAMWRGRAAFSGCPMAAAF